MLSFTLNACSTKTCLLIQNPNNFKKPTCKNSEKQEKTSKQHFALSGDPGRLIGSNSSSLEFSWMDSLSQCKAPQCRSKDSESPRVPKTVKLTRVNKFVAFCVTETSSAIFVDLKYLVEIGPLNVAVSV
jgi:hypothetical protein